MSTPPRRTLARVGFGAVAGLLAGAKAGFVLAGRLHGRAIVGISREVFRRVHGGLREVDVGPVRLMRRPFR
jgi:hypothetical protein